MEKNKEPKKHLQLQQLTMLYQAHLSRKWFLHNLKVGDIIIQVEFIVNKVTTSTNAVLASLNDWMVSRIR